MYIYTFQKIVPMKFFSILFLLFVFSTYSLSAQSSTAGPDKPLTPIMGWSSWNNFRVDIDENLIKEQADAMVTSGMKEAGYEFINIDDGYFGGRDKAGDIIPHPKRFPHGMKAVADYIHAKGLKAGIYSDAGANTCASMWDHDTIGVGMGLYHHEWQDIHRLLKDWNYDFLKVDWCGGETLGLDEQQRYTLIGDIIKATKPDALYNVCRWEFPGKWVVNTADSWRISGDISNTFESILHIIDRNADLWKYAGPGHVNDMDMLQVGRGMSYEEDKAHFSMWCMLASPLLAGNDLREMSDETIAILTNKEMIAIDQDPLVYQARRLKRNDDKEVWARPLQSTMSGKIAVALLNRSQKRQEISINVDSLGLKANKGYTIREVWKKTTAQNQHKMKQKYMVEPHGIVVLRLEGSAQPFNVFQEK